MSDTRYANLLIDTADRLAEARNGNESWDAIQTVAKRIGATAVNAGGVITLPNSAGLRTGTHPAWMRSSMEDTWLEEYQNAELYRHDPVLRSALMGLPPPSYYDVRAAHSLERTEPQLAPLHDGLLRHDYRFVLAHMWYEKNLGKCIVLGCSTDPRDLFGPGTERAFSTISAMLAMRLQPPDEGVGEASAFGIDWLMPTPQEFDVLCYLARGLNEAEVAERLGISLTEVRRRVRNVAHKMGAETPDQTLALALSRGLLPL